MQKPKLPVLYHECGWVARPGQVIACDDPRIGPFYCPSCQGSLRTDG